MSDSLQRALDAVNIIDQIAEAPVNLDNPVFGPGPEPPTFESLGIEFPDFNDSTVVIFDPGPVVIGIGSSNGIDNHKLQVTGDSYFNGNVGIGTTDIFADFTVVGDSYFVGIVTVQIGHYTDYVKSPIFIGDLLGVAQLSEKSIISDNVTGLANAVLYNSSENLTASSSEFTYDGTKLVIGDDSSLGDILSQKFRVIGDAYIGGKLGIRNINPTADLDVGGSGKFSDSVTSPTFIGDLVGTAERAEVANYVETTLNVIGGIASVSELRVSGVSTLNTAIVGILTVTNELSILGYLKDTVNSTGNPGQVLISDILGPRWGNVGSLLPPLQTIEVLDDNIPLPHYVSRLNFKDSSDPDNLVTIATGFSTEYADIFISDRWTLKGQGSYQISTDVYRISKVGIGTINPQYDLDVFGNARITNNLGIGSLYVSGISTFFDRLNVNGTLSLSNGLNVISGISTLKTVSATSLYVTGLSTFISDLNITGLTSIGSSLTVSSNVGIGSTLPKSKLDVVGDGKFTGVVTATRFFGTVSYADTSGISTNVIGGIASVANLSVSGISTFTNGPILVGSITSTGTASQNLQVTGGAYISNNLGLGVVNPTSKLSVDGNVYVTGVVTAVNFYGNVVGFASTAYYSLNSGISTNVIGGVASVTQLNVSGVSTVGFLTASNIRVSAAATVGFLTATDVRVSGTATVGFLTASNTFISGTATVGFLTATDVRVSGTATVGFLTASNTFVSGTATVGLLNASNTFVSGTATVGFLTATDVRVSGTATVGFLTVTDVRVSGTATVGFLTATDVRVSGTATVGFLTASNTFVSGTATVGFLTSSNTFVSGTATVGFLTATDVRVSGSVTATNFYGQLVGIASTARYADVSGVSTSVIGGIASVAQLSVTGVSTLFSNVSIGATLTVSNKVGIGSTLPKESLDVVGNANISGIVTATSYRGDGVALVGIVTQITSGIGIDLVSSQLNGKGSVEISAYRPVGKTIYVSQTGDDNNTGLAENYPKRSIKAAAAVALYGDTIKVFPGVYLEENPIVLSKTVSVEGTELRNCVITPKYPDRDLFYVNNGCHITDLSFIGPEIEPDSSIVSFQPLQGVSDFRFFDAARMIRFNLDYIARESVGFLTSGFSGFAGNHREQDAARLIDLNIDYIASETIGFLTSTSYKNPAFVVPTVPGDCEDDIKDILRSISYDLKAGSNRKSIGAGLTYYNSNGGLLHITGTDVNGYSVRQATVDAIEYAIGIVTYVINNQAYPTQYTNLDQNTTSYSPVLVVGGCGDTIVKIESLAGIVTSIVGLGTLQAPPEVYGVNLETDICARDLKLIWKSVCHDITRGGNSKCVGAGKSYYDENWNPIPEILKNPQEFDQMISTVDYSFNIARSIINNCTWGGYPVGIATDVVNAQYDHITGITTITTNGPHGLFKDNPVKIVGLGFTCNYDNGSEIKYFPRESDFGVIFPVQSIVGPNTFTFVGGASTLPHYYTSGGTVQKYTNFQDEYVQLKDLGIQADSETGFNNSINSCQNVVSALRSCVGVVTSIIKNGSNSGITTTYPGNSGVGFTSIVGIATASYDHTSGKTTITAPGVDVREGEFIELYDLIFSCNSGGPTSTQKFPSGRYGNEFCVNKVYQDGSFDIYVGVSTIPHAYETGGYIIDRSVGVTTATYDYLTGITTITSPGAYVRVGDFVTLSGLGFTCPSDGGVSVLSYPTGNNGYLFEVTEVIGTGTTFVVNTGVGPFPHKYVSGGVVKPSYSKGVGPITQGPYIRNCTNFIGKSIGMKVDGFHAEPGDQDDVGVTGAMSVDSYTQYNQGGIGVSITNGAYAQLVSIFTICDDIAIYTGSGGQCDITNSNSSFGTFGLVSNGVGDADTGSIYRYTGVSIGTTTAEQDRIVIGGIGSYRPYDGQTLYFGELYYTVQRVEILDGGSGYTTPPIVYFDMPTGQNGIKAEGSANVENGKVVSVDIISSGNQYSLTGAGITFGGPGVGAAATPIMAPIYYTIENATLPNSGITTVTLAQNLNNVVSAGTTVYFSRLSLQIASSHSFEWVGSGNTIGVAKPALGGVVVQDNEIVKISGGEIVYTSTDQAGNFRIGEGVVINQVTGTISGRAFSQSLLNTVTPLVIALSR